MDVGPDNEVFLSATAQGLTFDFEKLINEAEVQADPLREILFTFPDDDVTVVTKKRKTRHPSNSNPPRIPVTSPPKKTPFALHCSSISTCPFVCSAAYGCWIMLLVLLHQVEAMRLIGAGHYVGDFVEFFSQDWVVLGRKYTRKHGQTREQVPRDRLLLHVDQQALPHHNFEQFDDMATTSSTNTPTAFGNSVRLLDLGLRFIANHIWFIS